VVRSSRGVVRKKQKFYCLNSDTYTTELRQPLKLSKPWKGKSGHPKTANPKTVSPTTASPTTDNPKAANPRSADLSWGRGRHRGSGWKGGISSKELFVEVRRENGIVENVPRMSAEYYKNGPCMCSLNVPSMFPQCHLNVPSTFPESSHQRSQSLPLNVHRVFPSTFPESSLNALGSWPGSARLRTRPIGISSTFRPITTPQRGST
jgi:hypothetical protein